MTTSAPAPQQQALGGFLYAAVASVASDSMVEFAKAPVETVAEIDSWYYAYIIKSMIV